MPEQCSRGMRRIVVLSAMAAFCAALLLLPFVVERLLGGGWLLERYLALGALVAYLVLVAGSGPSTSPALRIHDFAESTPPKPMPLSDGSLVYLHLSRPRGEDG